MYCVERVTLETGYPQLECVLINKVVLINEIVLVILINKVVLINEVVLILWDTSQAVCRGV